MRLYISLIVHVLCLRPEVVDDDSLLGSYRYFWYATSPKALNYYVFSGPYLQRQQTWFIISYRKWSTGSDQTCIIFVNFVLCSENMGEIVGDVLLPLHEDWLTSHRFGFALRTYWCTGCVVGVNVQWHRVRTFATYYINTLTISQASHKVYTNYLVGGVLKLNRHIYIYMYMH